MVIKYFRQWILIIIVGILTGCANLPLQPISPQVSLADFRLINLGLIEQNYLLKLHLKNPNPFPLPINSLNYQLQINDQIFAKGMSNKAVSIPASGEEFLVLQVASNLMRTIGQFSDLKTLINRNFNYQLSGNVNVISGFQLPFEYQGEVPLLWKDSEF